MSFLLNENPYGVKMYRRDFKTRSQVKVVFEEDGQQYHIRTYRFNNIPDTFESPYCSWANLDCCGGWRCDEEYLDTAVQEGKKLYAGRVTSLKSRCTPQNPTRSEALTQFHHFKSTLPTTVVADIEELLSDKDYLYTFICRTGKISDYFDMDDVFRFYAKHGIEISDTVKGEICRLCDYEIRIYGTKDAPYPYTHSEGIAQLITTGLLLGYPIESTVSLITGY